MSKVFDPKITPGPWDIEVEDFWIFLGQNAFDTRAHDTDIQAMSSLPELLALLGDVRDMLDADERNEGNSRQNAIDRIRSKLDKLDEKFGKESGK